MRVLMTVQIPAEAGNRAIRDGTLPKILEGFMASAEPEASFFGLRGGDRTMFLVFDLEHPSHIPAIAEPFFTGLEAKIEWQPIMDLADLQKGLAAAAA